MSTLIRHGRVEADDYRLVADEADLPAAGRIIVSLARWQAEYERLKPRAAEIGLRLPNTADVETLAPLLLDRPLLALEFPGFADGRAYSQARLLAERLGYRGELRATGKAVVRDQFHFMLRCGFNSFELRDDQQADACLKAIAEFSLSYQRAADDSVPVYARRRRIGG